MLVDVHRFHSNAPGNAHVVHGMHLWLPPARVCCIVRSRYTHMRYRRLCSNKSWVLSPVLGACSVCRVAPTHLRPHPSPSRLVCSVWLALSLSDQTVVHLPRIWLHALLCVPGKIACGFSNCEVVNDPALGLSWVCPRICPPGNGTG